MKILELIKNSQEIVNIFDENNLNLDDEIINKNLSTLYDYYIYLEDLKNGSSIEKSKNLVYSNEQFYIISEFSGDFLNKNPYFKIKEFLVYEDLDLKNFNWSLSQISNQNLKENDLAIKNSINNILKSIKEILTKDSWKGLYIFGEPGVGKSHILKSIAKEMAKKKKTVVITTFENLLQITKDGYSKTDNQEQNLSFRTCQKVDVLLLDDLGIERANKWSRDEILFPIINYRIEHKKLTFFASNLSMEELQEKYTKVPDGVTANQEITSSKRIMDRMRGLVLAAIKINGKSRR